MKQILTDTTEIMKNKLNFLLEENVQKLLTNDTPLNSEAVAVM
jgi:hypothetical protein